MKCCFILVLAIVVANWSNSIFCEAEVKDRGEYVSTIILEDVHGLFGGQNAYITKDCKAIIRIATPSLNKERSGLQEKRYTFELNKKDFEQIIKVLLAHNVFNINIPDRFGVPDESRSVITIKMSTGKMRIIAKWANDKHPDFDSIYHELLRIVKMAEQESPIYKGAFDYKWQPQEFK